MTQVTGQMTFTGKVNRLHYKISRWKNLIE